MFKLTTSNSVNAASHDYKWLGTTVPTAPDGYTYLLSYAAYGAGSNDTSAVVVGAGQTYSCVYNASAWAQNVNVTFRHIYIKTSYFKQL